MKTSQFRRVVIRDDGVLLLGMLDLRCMVSIRWSLLTSSDTLKSAIRLDTASEHIARSRIDV